MNKNTKKYMLRGSIKEIMKNYGLRTISLANYRRFNGDNSSDGIHSIKYDIMNGYIHLHGYGSGKKCGDALEDVEIDVYSTVYNQILNILENEEFIPSKVKRNILVKVNR
jgi:hypothetical protein